jgi:hypothetical protein
MQQEQEQEQQANNSGKAEAAASGAAAARSDRSIGKQPRAYEFTRHAWTLRTWS